MKKKVQIRILTQYFYPDIASTGQLLTELALKLSELGVNVSAITAFPTYTKTRIKAKGNEEFNGVKISRLLTTRLNKNTKIGQILNSFTFFFRAFIKITFSKDKTPLLIVSNPPFLPFLGVIMKKLKNIEFIYIVHDVYPEKILKLNYIKTSSTIYKIWEKIDIGIIRNSFKVIVLSDSMKSLIQKKIDNTDISTNKIKVIHNWADKNFIKNISKTENQFSRKYNLGDEFLAIYSGNLGISYNLEVLIATAQQLSVKNFKLIFVGDGVKRNSLEQKTKELGLENVVFIDYQSREMFPHVLAASDILIVTYEEELEGLLMPSKLYTSMAAGKPILALCGQNSEVSRIINSANCGEVVNTSANEISNSIAKLMEHHDLREMYGRNARQFFENNFELEISANKYFEVINNFNG